MLIISSFKTYTLKKIQISMHNHLTFSHNWLAYFLNIHEKQGPPSSLIYTIRALSKLWILIQSTQDRTAFWLINSFKLPFFCFIYSSLIYSALTVFKVLSCCGLWSVPIGQAAWLQVRSSNCGIRPKRTIHHGCLCSYAPFVDCGFASEWGQVQNNFLRVEWTE